mgnify:CR=1 FL=1
MIAQIYRYTKVVVPGPDGYTLYAKLPEGGMELCVLDGVTYVTVPEDADPLPEQHQQITLEPVIVDAGLRERLLTESRAGQLISQAIIDKIRAKYPIDEELYFARIGIGSLTDLYTPSEAEVQELAAYGQYVESVREWGRQQRAALGL